MSAVLGVSAGYHDAAAALVIDGCIVAAMQEERFSRVKNDPSLPLSAIAACLRAGGIAAGALDAVVFYENPYAKLERVMLSALRSFPRSFWQFPRAMASQLAGKVWVKDALADRLDVDRAKVTHQEHHRSHAASAFYTGPFARAAVLTVDAVGEEASTAIWKGDGKSLERVDQIAFPHSLGLLYAAITAYLGFEVNEGEYKVMGLAAFGVPALEDELAKIVTLHDDGTFALALPYFASHTDTELGFGKKVEALLGPRRSPGAPWDLASDRDRRYANVAATLQAVTERAMLGLAARARRLTGEDALCLAGGVALNAVCNAKIPGPLFVHPAAGDAGGALGAAILGAIDRGDPRPAALATAALGEAIDAGEALQLARALGLNALRTNDPIAAAAEQIARGDVIAFAQGRFEWGPRALGQRSILARPAPAEIKERINRVIKRREPFRPFAPAVLSQDAPRYFGSFAEHLAPFMTTTAPVKDPDALAAVTHIDGSARLQTVAESSVFGDLIARVGRATGTPIVLNTSLNGKGEPIVAGAADALSFFMAHPVDALFVEDVLITRGKPE
ncbi:MAG: carbamoyl transferase [Deltaproteobacteria bacterium]|nr:carbamoyl transferase [Deltaproteobacteria bacterium]